jgi:hypothetical protein
MRLLIVYKSAVSLLFSFYCCRISPGGAILCCGIEKTHGAKELALINTIDCYHWFVKYLTALEHSTRDNSLLSFAYESIVTEIQAKINTPYKFIDTSQARLIMQKRNLYSKTRTSSNLKREKFLRCLVFSRSD